MKDNIGSEVPELWKIRGSTRPIYSQDKITISYVVVEHYLDGNEKLLFDNSRCIHRINGIDKMEQTRKNLGIE